MQQVEDSIARYLTELDRADREPTAVLEGRVSHLKEKIEGLKAQMKDLKQIGTRMQQAPDRQISLTDSDARSMATSGRGTAIVGYNVKTAVDTKHHMIVGMRSLTSAMIADRSGMAARAQDAIVVKITVLADRGYFDGEEILACERAGTPVLVPKPQTSNNNAQGLFDRLDFRYIPRADDYRCPAGKRVNGQSGASRVSRRASPCTRIGPPPAPDVRSKHNARLESTGALSAGSTRARLRRCSGVWNEIQTHRDCAGKL